MAIEKAIIPRIWLGKPNNSDCQLSISFPHETKGEISQKRAEEGFFSFSIFSMRRVKDAHNAIELNINKIAP